MISESKIITKLRDKTLNVRDILSVGGSWLGSCRNWIQWHCRNGSDVTWGSNDYLQIDRITVADLEAFAAKIAMATLEGFSELLVTEGEKYALKEYLKQENWADLDGVRIAFKPNRDRMHWLMSYYHKNGWDLADIVDQPKAEASNRDTSGKST